MVAVAHHRGGASLCSHYSTVEQRCPKEWKEVSGPCMQVTSVACRRISSGPIRAEWGCVNTVEKPPEMCSKTARGALAQVQMPSSSLWSRMKAEFQTLACHSPVQHVTALSWLSFLLLGFFKLKVLVISMQLQGADLCLVGCFPFQ